MHDQNIKQGPSVTDSFPQIGSHARRGVWKHVLRKVLDQETRNLISNSSGETKVNPRRVLFKRIGVDMGWKGQFGRFPGAASSRKCPWKDRNFLSTRFKARNANFY